MRSNQILSLFLCSLFIISCADKKETANTLALTHATIYDGTGNKLEDATIFITDDRISAVGNDIKIPENTKEIDLNGKFIAPGLVDAHIHFFQTAFFDARPDALNLKDSLPYEKVYNYQKEHANRYYEAYLRSGVTAVYDVGDFTWTYDMPAKAEADSLSPHVATAGPLLTPFSEEAVASFNTSGDTVMISLHDEKTGRDYVKKATNRGSTGIKIWSLNTSDSLFMKGLDAVADEVKKQGNQLIVHATTLEQAKAALKDGATLLVHSVEDTLIDQEFIDLAKANKTYYDPTLVVARGYYNTYMAILGEKFELNDPHHVVDEKTREQLTNAEGFKSFFEDTLQTRKNMQAYDERLKKRDTIMFANLKRVYEAGIPIVVGTDAGNPGTVHGISIYDEMEQMQRAGIPAKDLIVMATKNGAIAMRRANDFGTLEAGKLADLIVLDNDPGDDISNMRSITHFMRAGHLQSVETKFEK